MASVAPPKPGYPCICRLPCRATGCSPMHSLKASSTLVRPMRVSSPGRGLRDHAAELFEVTTGFVWRPRTGSILNHRALTAAVIDSRDYLAARRRAETELHIPAGTRIAFTGGVDCNDHHRIWAVLDKARAKHPDMVLLHGGSPKGAERIAACW